MTPTIPPELQRLLTISEAAAMLKVSPGTLKQWRDAGTGPKWIRINPLPKGIRYQLYQLQIWIDSQPEQMPPFDCQICKTTNEVGGHKSGEKISGTLIACYVCGAVYSIKILRERAGA